MSSNPLPPSSAEEIQVRLKPIFGLEPKYYLAGIYSALILVVLVALFVLPGLTRPGTRVTITSTPPGAAVFWNDKNWGVTPVTAFLPQGTGTLKIERPGFRPYEAPFASGNRVFLSLFLPKSAQVNATLVPDQTTDLGTKLQAELGRWTLAAPFTDDYRFPPLFTEFRSDARAAGWTDDKINMTLLSTRPLVADHQVYDNLGRALGLWNDSPPSGVQAQARLWSQWVKDDPARLAFWVLLNQSKADRDRDVTEPSDWLNTQKKSLDKELQSSISQTGSNPATVTVQGTRFTGVAGRTFLWGGSANDLTFPGELPYLVPFTAKVAPFLIADRDVTQAEFAVFLKAHPEWAPSARDTLIAQGWATKDYLNDWKDGHPSQPQQPVVNVSWYAAAAYVDWWNSLNTSRHASLPSEIEWEAAGQARGGVVATDTWVWTKSPWIPAPGLVDSAADLPQFSYAKVLRGGVSGVGTPSAHARAGWPAAGSTPRLGIRLVLEPS